MSLSLVKRLLCSAIATMLLMGFAGQAQSQGSYPNKPVHILVGFAPGGLTDVYARLFAAHMQTKIGQPFLVENKPGAATMLATQALVRSPADGYTLCFCVSNVLTNSFFRDKMPYQPSDLASVGVAFRSTSVLIVPDTSPFQDVAQLVEFARKNPGKLNYSTTGAGGATHIAGELFLSLANIKATAIHYKGASPATMAVGTKEVDFTFSAVNTAQPLLQDGRVRAFGLTSDQRSSALPGVPTLTEKGFPGLSTGVWYGLMAPAGTPPAVIELLNKELNSFFSSGAMRERVLAGGEIPLGNMSPQQMADYIAKDAEVLRKVIQPLNHTVLSVIDRSPLFLHFRRGRLDRVFASAAATYQRRVGIESRTCRCGRTGAPWDVTFGYGRLRAPEGVFFGVLAVQETLPDQKAVGGYAKRCMVVKAAPASSLEVVQSEFLLELLVVTLDAPATLDGVHELLAPDVRGQCAEEVFGGLGLAVGPFDEQPLLITRHYVQVVAMRRRDAHCGKARGELRVGSFTPCKFAVG